MADERRSLDNPQTETARLGGATRMSDERGVLRADSARLSRFIVGPDGDGHWVVRDRRALCGGLFVNREDAVRYAKFESDGIADQVTLADKDVHFEVTPRTALDSLGSCAEGDDTAIDGHAGQAFARGKAA
ncbi:MAG: hypothetical protein E7774_00790 [Bradyrhizobium sp.]|nr:MAG: hypothetical protein E7774_00790 [Bradyrhizobium sp.]